jgi:hypothetical protein
LSESACHLTTSTSRRARKAAMAARGTSRELPTLVARGDRSECAMPSAVPVVACIVTTLSVFIVGSHIYGERSGQVARLWSHAEPLFARSVEQHSLAPDRWPQGRLEVPYYGPMVELLTLGASRSRPQQAEGLRQPAPEQPKFTSARERREDIRRQRAKRERAPDNETIDPGDAYAREEPQQRGRRSSSAEDERRLSHGFNRGQETRHSRAGNGALLGRRPRGGETGREPERGPEQRSPSESREGRDGFNLFGGFQRR